MGYGMSAPTYDASHNVNLSLHSLVLGKAEGSQQEWHGHVTALTVAPEYRRLGLARRMMVVLEAVSDEIYQGFFVDLCELTNTH
jgi:N-terminal acetyltransferase B complex catalytic subunit